MPLQSDARVQWIRQRVVLGLDVQDDAFSYMLSPPKVRNRELPAYLQCCFICLLPIWLCGSQHIFETKVVTSEHLHLHLPGCARCRHSARGLFACLPLSWSQDATNPGAGCGAAAVAAFLDGTAATASGSSTLFFFAEEEEVEVSREVEEQYEEQIPIETSAELLNGAAGSEAGADGSTPDATAKVSCSTPQQAAH
jgi:hypothetical protein